MNSSSHWFKVPRPMLRHSQTNAWNFCSSLRRAHLLFTQFTANSTSPEMSLNSSTMFHNVYFPINFFRTPIDNMFQRALHRGLQTFSIKLSCLVSSSASSGSSPNSTMCKKTRWVAAWRAPWDEDSALGLPTSPFPPVGIGLSSSVKFSVPSSLTLESNDLT